jgi:hypothetical protein
MRFIDLTGRKFGRLQVVQRLARTSSGIQWLCLCDCGAKTIVSRSNLAYGGSKSCGCLRKEISFVNAFRHGHKGSSEYAIWVEMRHRCRNPAHKQYADYGGRGIDVCQRWDSDFLAFLNDMGPRPRGRSIDRINNNGNYEPGNCRWATPLQQTHNRRNSRGSM